MKKLVLLFVFFLNFVLSAQVKNDEVYKINSAVSISDFQFSKEYNYASDYQKYLDFSIPFSIYNPKPGFQPTKMEKQKYYSFTNTNLLLRRQMSTIEPTPIFPDQDKKKTFGEAIFEGVLDAVFDKKQK